MACLYCSSLDHDLMASIWVKAISILAGNLNSGRSYLITAVLYLPCSRQRTSYVEDRTIDVRTFPFPGDIWFDIFVFGLLSSWVLSSEDSFSVVYIYWGAVTKITFGLVTNDYMRDICEIKCQPKLMRWNIDISNQTFTLYVKLFFWHQKLQIENP